MPFVALLAFALPTSAAIFDTYPRQPGIDALHYTFRLTLHDDTDMILSEIVENGYDSERGRAFLDRLNKIHSHFNISNELYLYVLSTFVYEPSSLVAGFGEKA